MTIDIPKALNVLVAVLTVLAQAVGKNTNPK